jgi:hypothetical protein
MPRRCTKSHQSDAESAKSSGHGPGSRPDSRSRPVFELEVIVVPKQRAHGKIHPSPGVDAKPTSANKRIVGRVEEKSSSLCSSVHRSPRKLTMRIVLRIRDEHPSSRRVGQRNSQGFSRDAIPALCAIGSTFTAAAAPLVDHSSQGLQRPARHVVVRRDLD